MPQTPAAPTAPVTTTTERYVVEEYLPHSQRWVPASAPEEDIAEATRLRDLWAPAFADKELFRITKVTTVTTVEIVG